MSTLPSPPEDPQRPSPRPSEPPAGDDIEEALARALDAVQAPLQVLRGPRGLRLRLDEPLEAPIPHGHRLLAQVPALGPGSLGDRTFLLDHRLDYPYVAGSMANGIASVELVEAMGRSGMLGFFGAAGLDLDTIERALERLEESLGRQHLPFGANLIHSPSEPLHEAQTVELYLRRGLGLIEASAFLDVTQPLVHYRTRGLHRGPDGRVIAPHKVLGKVSRSEVARKLLSPAPGAILDALVRAGRLEEEEARLAREVPLVDDLTAEADSGGHTDNRPLVTLLPELIALRDELAREHGWTHAPRIGAAGGIGTPFAAHAAFSLGAAYVMAGSVHQACVESGSSDLVRRMLAEAGPADIAMAPAADMFEMGVKVQVLKRGTLFASRAARLHEVYRTYPSIEAIPAREREQIEAQILRAPMEAVWQETRAYFLARDPLQVTRAESDPRHRMALVFRSYLGRSSRWANAGVEERKLDFQIWCGPAMGAFNEWTRGTFLQDPSERKVVTVARNVLHGAAVLARARWLEAQGVAPPRASRRPVPRTLPALETLDSAPRSSPGRGAFAARVQGAAGAAQAPSTGSLEVGDGARTPEEAGAEPPAQRGFPSIAIVGLGCLFPRAEGLEGYWSNIVRGVDAIEEIPATHWRPEDYYDPDPKAPDLTYARRGGFIVPVPFRPLDYGISPRDLEAIDTAQLLGLVVAERALADAGYPIDDDRWSRKRTSVILGVTGTLELVIPLGARLGHPAWRRALDAAGVPPAQRDEALRRISESYVPWQENSFPGLLGNVVAGRIANRFDLGGTNCVVDAACASSLSALHLAALELDARRSDMVITGGVDTFNDIFMYMCFSKTPALSPTGDARPFDSASDGTILGEGIGMVVLKRLEDALRDGDRVYAVIRGVGSSSDGKGGAIYAPKGAGQMAALRSAYDLAGVAPASVELVEAHGTGTRVGDSIEADALSAVYASASPSPAVPTLAGGDSGETRERPWCALGSVKSQIGHTKAAAGAAGLIKAALALHHRVLPPTIKVRQPLDAVSRPDSPFYLNQEPRPWVTRPGAPRRAGVSAFGFGGSNFHCVLEEAPQGAGAPVGSEREVWIPEAQLLAFSAPTRAGLLEKVKATLAALPGRWPELRARAAALREAFDAREAERLTVLVEERDARTPGEALAEALAELERRPEARSWTTPRGAAHGAGEPGGRLAALFPGQGAQYPGMLRDLACRFPELIETLEEAEDGFDAADCSLADLLYPRQSSPAEGEGEAAARLRRTEVAQPALAAVTLGALGVLRRFGVEADAYAGHSFGELVALTAAGALASRDLHILARLRGRLMAGAAAGGRQKPQGAMLAVEMSEPEAMRFLELAGLGLSIANKNAPRQVVLSGAAEEIERALHKLAGEGVRGVRLDVSAAFHSPLVEPAQAPLRAALDGIGFSTLQKDVYANATGEPYPRDPTGARELLGRQLSSPVEFVRQIEALHRDGVRTFVEVGPGARLSGLVRKILAREVEAGAVRVLALDASRRHGLRDLALVLGQLAAEGRPVSLSRWDTRAREAAPPPERKGGLTVEICGANYVPPPRAEGIHSSSPPAPMAVPAVPAVPAATAATAATVRVPPAAVPVAPTPPVATEPPVQGAGRPEASRPVVSRPDPSPPPELALNRPTIEPGALGRNVEAIERLERLHTETARIHRKFLETQEAAFRAIETLLQDDAPSPLERAPAPLAAPALAAPSTGPRAILGGASSESATPEGAAARQAVLRAAAAPFVASPEPRAEPARAEPAAAARSPAPEPSRSPATGTDGARDSAPADPSAAIASALLRVVAEKTGYPAEMLELPMALEADLGIDSIKRVEILSALRDAVPGAAEVPPDALGRLRTLADVVQLLAATAPPAAAPVAGPGPADGTPKAAARPVGGETVRGQTAPGADPSAAIASALLRVVAEKTGYPAEMLELPMALEADLGIDSIKRVEILSALRDAVPGAAEVPPDALGRLRTLADVVQLLAATAPPATAPVVPATTAPALEGPRPSPPPAPAGGAAGEPPLARAVLSTSGLPPVDSEEALGLRGGVWIVAPVDPREDALVAALTEAVRSRSAASSVVVSRPDPAAPAPLAFGPLPEPLAGLILLAPREGASLADHQRALLAVQTAAVPLARRAREGGASVVLVSRLDGAFGLESAPRSRALSGGHAGLSKTLRLEWPTVSVKAVDLDPALSDGDAKAAALALTEELLHRGAPEVGLSRRGRRAPVLVEKPALPATTPRRWPPGSLVVVTGGARGVTVEAAAALASLHRPTLLLLGRTTLAAPGTSSSLPLAPGRLDEMAAKRALLDDAQRRTGRALSPRALEEAYRRALHEQEARGTLARLEALGARALYRSVDVRSRASLAAAISEARAEHGPVRGLVHGAGILADRRVEDLGPEDLEAVWATKVSSLLELLELLEEDPLETIILYSSYTARHGRVGQAAYAIANEALNKLAQAEARRRPGALVRSLNWGPWRGGMVTPSLERLFADEGVGLIELDAGRRQLERELLDSSTDDVEVLLLGAGAALPSPVGPTLLAPRQGEGSPVVQPPAPGAALLLELRASVTEHPFLASHVLGGRAVLPVAMYVEWLAHAALHAHPGLHFHGIDQLRVLRGVQVGASEVAQLRFYEVACERGNGSRAVTIELRCGLLDAERTHARATVLLGQEAPVPREAAARSPLLEPLEPCAFTVEEAYAKALFHGAHFRGLEAIEGWSPEAIAGLARAAPPPRDWILKPLRGQWIADPLVLDVAFQLLILWSVERHGTGSLPVRIGSYRQLTRTFPRRGVRILARIRQSDERRAVADIDFLDEGGRPVASIEDYECILDGSLERAFRANQLTS